MRWVPAQHDEAAFYRAWADERKFEKDIVTLLEGRDPGGLKLRAKLSALDDPVRRPEVLEALLGYWERSGHPSLARVLKAFPADFAKVVVTVSSRRPEYSMRLADRFFFTGTQKVEAAWAEAGLVNTVVRLCKRTDFSVADLETGPARVWALKVAGKARLKEAIPEITKAAGLGKTPQGQPRLADPFGPARSMAERIIADNRRKRRAAKARQ